LFVINLTDPTAPTVLGELKIPGHSDYLHPYEENHLIGVGKETAEAESEDFVVSRGQNLHLRSLEREEPTQMSNATIGDRGTDSPVLGDHKAFLFDKERHLLVIPATVGKIDQSQYPHGGMPSWTYGTPIWQGAYVYNISLTDGLVLRGKITHGQDTGLPPYELYVSRALYMGDVLYTIWQGKIKLNSLADLAFLKEVSLD